MKNARFFAWLTLAVGIAATSASTLSAQDWNNIHRDGQDLRSDYRDINHDHNRADQVRADIARDRARLAEDTHRGRYAAASQDRRDLARDQRLLDALVRDVRHDQFDSFRDRQDVRRDFRN